MPDLTNASARGHRAAAFYRALDVYRTSRLNTTVIDSLVETLTNEVENGSAAWAFRHPFLGGPADVPADAASGDAGLPADDSAGAAAGGAEPVPAGQAERTTQAPADGDAGGVERAPSASGARSRLDNLALDAQVDAIDDVVDQVENALQKLNRAAHYARQLRYAAKEDDQGELF